MAVTKEQVRKYINDFASKNSIFVEREFDDSDIENSIYWAEQACQGVPPFIDNFSASTVPSYIMLLGTLAQLFRMAALHNIRNMANVSEQGIPVPVGENGNIYEQLATKYEQNFERQLNGYKLKVNIENMMSYQSSPYENY